MIRDKKIQLATFAASILAAVLIQGVSNRRSLGFAEVLGGTIGLMLIPFLLAMIIKWTVKAFSKDFSEKAFLIAFLVVWGFLVLANVIVA